MEDRGRTESLDGVWYRVKLRLVESCCAHTEDIVDW